MIIDLGALTSDLTLRDAIRVESLLNIALNLAKAGHNPGISGSVALMLHLGRNFRVPADLDFIFDTNNSRERAMDYSLLTFDLAAVPLNILLMDGRVIGTELTILCRDEAGRALDRVVCQLVQEDDTESAYHEFVSGPYNLRVETLESITAAKIDALFKERSNGTVSSRCRDLFDLALLMEAGALPPHADVAKFATLMLPGPPSAKMVYPKEWLPVWRDLKRTQNTDMTLSDAWTETLSFARSLWKLE